MNEIFIDTLRILKCCRSIGVAIFAAIVFNEQIRIQYTQPLDYLGQLVSSFKQPC